MPKWRVTTSYCPADRFFHAGGFRRATVDVEAMTHAEALSEAITATYEQIGWSACSHVTPLAAVQTGA